MTKNFADRLHANSPVQRIERLTSGGIRLLLTDPQGNNQNAEFDQVILACHSDQALAMLAEPSRAESTILGAMPYRPNTTSLHTDASLMPRHRRAWAAWNAHPGAQANTTAVTYDLTHLQGLPGPERFFVSLESEALLQQPAIKTLQYAHPQMTAAAVKAQAEWSSMSGVDRVHYCGAYWGFGFHEDGFVSGMRVANALGAGWDTRAA
jgi:predicted NAD/FAD-binding protein